MRSGQKEPTTSFSCASGAAGSSEVAGRRGRSRRLLARQQPPSLARAERPGGAERPEGVGARVACSCANNLLRLRSRRLLARQQPPSLALSSLARVATFCGRSGQILGLSGGYPPNPPFGRRVRTCARPHTSSETCWGGRSLCSRGAETNLSLCSLSLAASFVLASLAPNPPVQHRLKRRLLLDVLAQHELPGDGRGRSTVVPHEAVFGRRPQRLHRELRRDVGCRKRRPKPRDRGGCGQVQRAVERGRGGNRVRARANRACASRKKSAAAAVLVPSQANRACASRKKKCSCSNPGSCARMRHLEDEVLLLLPWSLCSLSASRKMRRSCCDLG
jgi:hypothetical protein